MTRRKATKKSSSSGAISTTELQVQGHLRTREAHLSELAEDYLEVIADLLEERGQARTTEIAKRLGVTHVTVSRKLTRLRQDGLVETEPYRSVFLTEEGRKTALKSRERHQVVLEFLKKLGVSEQTAIADSEGIEHHVSQETLRAFKRFVGDR